MPPRIKLPAPLLTRFTLPVPLPCKLLRITPKNVQSLELLTVSVLSVFRPVLSKSPSITALASPLMLEKVCVWPFKSNREPPNGALNVNMHDEAKLAVAVELQDRSVAVARLRQCYVAGKGQSPAGLRSH